jgi:hypothetical protein
MSDKIKPHHLGRKAILYVRQSSAHFKKARYCNMRCEIGFATWAGAKSKPLTMISVARRPAPYSRWVRADEPARLDVSGSGRSIGGLATHGKHVECLLAKSPEHQTTRTRKRNLEIT